MASTISIPQSSSTVSVSVIDTTTALRGVPAAHFIQPTHKGHEYLAVPSYSFLIRNSTLKRTILFDLGMRKDWKSLSPAIQRQVKQAGVSPYAKQHVRDILEEHGVDTKTVEAVVWSHWHFDHTGDPSTFDPSTALIVGPGFKHNLLPGYPANPESPILESDYAGRELREISFIDSETQIGQLPAVDYFGDGSFYLVDAPGHAVGHMCGLARVTSNPDSFILMGADACHHIGELRPNPHCPLPETIEPHPFHCGGVRLASMSCPGSLFEPLLRGGNKTKPVYEPASDNGMHFDPGETMRTIQNLQGIDAADNILTIIAHDEHLLDVIDFFPKTANAFVRNRWRLESRWSFLRDFAHAVGWQEAIEPKRRWHNPGSEELAK